MTIAISGGLMSEWTKIADSSATPVFTANRKTLIVSIVVTPTNGTPTLSIARNDGAAIHYRRKGVAMTAGTQYVDDTPFVLDNEDTIEVTSGASGGDMDVCVTYLSPEAAANVRISN